MSTPETLRRTPLHALHVELGARMGPFAGYDMPIQYRAGVLAEHAHVRGKAGLFDVSHMGQASLDGPDHQTTARALERLAPADFLNLAPGRQRYSQFLNAAGGTIDDIMVTRPAAADGRLALVVNASRKEIDFAHLTAGLPSEVRLTEHPELALLALQGPLAVAGLARLAPPGALDGMAFMAARAITLDGIAAHVSRSGYTGEDGFEISVLADDALKLARRLLADPDVAPIGLGARDSLRLEAGLCLYGHELDETVDPIEAAIGWSIQKRRRIEGGFLGDARVQAALRDGPRRVRVGLKLDGRAPAREGAVIVGPDGQNVGVVTSGGFGPSVGGAIAMGFVPPALAAPGVKLNILVRANALPATVVALPFHPHAYKR